jgi:hypothetical protein
VNPGARPGLQAIDSRCLRTLRETGQRLQAWAHAHFSREAISTLPARSALWLREQVSREAFSWLLHVGLLLALLSLSRSLFFKIADPKHYEAPSIYVSMFWADLAAIASNAPKNIPIVPEFVVFLVPMLLFFVAGRRLRWTDWEHGPALRVYVMGVLLMFVWAAATQPYNVYLNQTHGLDRLLLTACGLLSLRYPLFIPLTVKMVILMLKEAYVPTPLDDFDFRAPIELMIAFSVFVWASISRTFKPVHYLIVAVASYAAFYYLAGIAKWRIAGGTWFQDNHVSNISVAGYVRGWLSIVPEHAFMRFAVFAREMDPLFQAYTLFIEIGAIIGMFLYRSLTRWWFLGCAFLNFGIFVMSGVCFWKWMVAGTLMFVWMGRSGRPIADRMFKYKLPLLLAIASVYYSGSRIWFRPTPVAWFDTRLTENYETYAIGASGKRYFVPATFFVPMDMHWVQGDLCYATNEHTMTGIYATGSASTSRILDTSTPEELWKRHERARTCKKKNQPRFDKFMKRYFRNLNHHGRKLRFLNYIGRPRHLWIFPKGMLEDGTIEFYEQQEKVVKIELWRSLVFNHDGALHRSPPKLTHTVDIPK